MNPPPPSLVYLGASDVPPIRSVLEVVREIISLPRTTFNELELLPICCESFHRAFDCAIVRVDGIEISLTQFGLLENQT